jgi:hypothetical protein
LRQAPHRALFVLHEGIPATVFESQVLMHVLRMRELGVAFDICAFTPFGKMYRDASKRLAALDVHGTKVSLHRCMPKVFFGARLMNAFLLRQVLRRAGPYQFLHCRTEYSAAIGGVLRRFNGLPVVWDARGHTIAETVASPDDGLLRKCVVWWRRMLVSADLRKAARNCTAALFVSEALRQVQGKSLGLQPVEITPCVADERAFYFDPELRRTMRAELQLGESDKVFVYCGSLAPWQCFGETMALFAKLHAREPDNTRFLVLTPDIARARTQAQAAGLPQSIVHFASVPLRAVNAYLNAADFGVLLRRPSPINQVASPIKYAEYAMAGLIVIANDTVAQVRDYGARLGNVIDSAIGLETPGFPTLAERTDLALRSAQLLGRAAMDERYMRIYKMVMERQS